MTLVVTRNVPERFRGFLASCMLELAPGVYASPAMTRGVRERVWSVLCEWSGSLGDDSGVLITWPEKGQPGNQALLTLGWARKSLIEVDGIWLDQREADESLKTE